MLKKKICLSLTLALLIFMGPMAFSQGRENLPQIDLPDYIISGVERATTIRGDRLAIQDFMPEILLPSPVAGFRPEIKASSIEVTPLRPKPSATFGTSQYAVEAHGGSFASRGLKLSGSKFLNVGILKSSAWYLRRPQRIEAGSLNSFGLGLGYQVKIASLTHLSLAAGIVRDDLNLRTATSGTREFTLARAEASVTPMLTPLGSLALTTSYQTKNMKLVGDEAVIIPALASMGAAPLADGSQPQLTGSNISFASVDPGDLKVTHSQTRILHSVELFKGFLQTSIVGSFEALDQEALIQQFLALRTQYKWWHLDQYKLKVGFGGGVYLNKSVSGKSTLLANPLLHLTWVPPIAGLLSLAWDPTVVEHSIESSVNKYGMLTNTIRSNIEVQRALIRLVYGRKFDPGFALRFSSTLQKSEQHPVPVPYSTGIWDFAWVDLSRFSTNLLVTYELAVDQELAAFCEYNQTSISGSGFSGRAPQIAPLQVGIQGQANWRNWQFKPRFSWVQKTLYSLNSELERPAHLESHVLVAYQFNQQLNVSVEAQNLLNSSYALLPGYDFAPLTILLKIGYRGNF